MWVIRRGDEAIGLRALLTVGYAAAVSAIAVAPNKAHITANTQNQLDKSFSDCERDRAAAHPVGSRACLSPAGDFAAGCHRLNLNPPCK
jgi:hypothetical protein